MSTASQSIRRKAAWPIVIGVLILVASHRAAPEGPDVIGFDKLVHFAVYGLLGTIVCRLGRGSRAAAWGFLAAAAFGAMDEVHQSFVPARSAELADWIADALGAALAVMLYTWWPWYRRWLEMPVGVRKNKKSRGQSPRIE